MSHDVLKAIKPWVKTFSAEIPFKYKHGDDVCVGGIIKKVLDLTELFEDHDGYAYVYIDDDVGEMTLLVPKEIYKSLDKIEEGEIVLAEGKILSPKQGITKGIDIVCWDIHPLLKKQP